MVKQLCFYFAIVVSLLATCFVVFAQSSMPSAEIYFPGEKYLKIDHEERLSVGNATYVNKIELRFRTLHTSGVLLLMMGAHGETLTLQLFHGRIRYIMCSQSNTIRYNCHKADIGKDLDDNKWHTLYLVRNNRLVELQVDDEVKPIINPLSLDRLTFQHSVLYLGGYEIDNTTLHGSGEFLKDEQLTFSGCLQLTEIDNRNPVFVDGNLQLKRNLNFIPFGKVQYECNNKNQEISPVEFQKPTSFAEIPLLSFNGDCYNGANSFTISFSIRTFTTTGIVFRAEETAGRRRGIQLSLENGGMKIEAAIGNLDRQKQLILLASTRQTIADGFWHNVYIRIERNHAILHVDGENTAPIGRKFKESDHVMSQWYDPIGRYQNSKQCFDLKRIRFGSRGDLQNREGGYGFVGCLHNLKINDEEISLLSSIDTNRHLLKGVRPGCTLRNKCFPNPCLNNGVCTQTWNEISCDCFRSSYIGKRCEQTIYQKSCTQYKELGLNTTSYCLIDGDGDGLMKPRTVLCQVDELDEVYTVVNHNRMGNFSASVGDESFHHYTFHKFKYDLDPTSIQVLIQNSVFCRQEVTFHCYNTPILNAPDGPPNVAWKTWHAQLRYRWGGVPVNSTGCSCGLTKSCLDHNKLCNCDSYNNRWATDTGYITDKSELPLKRLHVTGLNTGASFFNIGPLECLHDLRKGKANKIVLSHGDEILNKACVTASKRRTLIESAVREVAMLKYIQETNSIKLPPIITNKRNRDTKESEASGDGLSTLEIVFLTIACVATLLILVKFVFCSLFNKMNGQVVLNHGREQFLAAEVVEPPPHLRKTEHFVHSPDKRSDVFLLTPEKNRFDIKDRRVPTTSNFWV